jgi:ribonuclease BN (tRNA processing enzyme)
VLAIALEDMKILGGLTILLQKQAVKGVVVTHTHTDTHTQLSAIHPTYRSLAVPIKMFCGSSRNKKLFEPLSEDLAMVTLL